MKISYKHFMTPKILKAKSKSSTVRLSAAFNEHLPPGNKLPKAWPTPPELELCTWQITSGDPLA